MEMNHRNVIRTACSDTPAKCTAMDPRRNIGAEYAAMRLIEKKNMESIWSSVLIQDTI